MASAPTEKIDSFTSPDEELKQKYFMLPGMQQASHLLTYREGDIGPYLGDSTNIVSYCCN